MIQLDGFTHPTAIIIGFYSSTGPESGKSTVADLLLNEVEDLGYFYPCCLRMSFATPVKRFASNLYERIFKKPLPEAKKCHLFDGIIPSFTLRDFFVAIGDGLRQVDKTVWIYLFKRKLSEILRDDSSPWLIVVDDVRYRNECDFILESGGHVFNVVDTTGVGRPIDAGDLPDIFPSAYTIYNDKTCRVREEIHAKILPVLKPGG